MLRRRLPITVLMLALVSLVGAAEIPPLREPPGLGPLALPSQSPFPALRLTLEPRGPSPLDVGEWSARLSTTWVNVWNIDRSSAPDAGRFILDYEFLRSAVRVSRKLTEGLTVEGGVEIRSRFGGTMDSIIDEWHELFGIGDRGRESVPRDRFVFDIDRPDGSSAISLSSSDRGIYSRALQGAVQHDLRRRRRRGPAVGYAVTARVELDQDATGEESVDLGASMYVSQAIKTSVLRANVGLSAFGDDDLAGLDLRSTQAVLILGYEWRYMRRQSIVGQYLATEGAVSGISPYSGTTHEYSIGWKGVLSTGGMLEAGFVENFIELDNSPDFGVHVAFTQRFGGQKNGRLVRDEPAASR